MKQFIIMLTACILGNAVLATESNQIDSARIGQMFALKEDVIFDEGVHEVTLYSGIMTVYSWEEKSYITSNVFCGLKRHEYWLNGGRCPEYPNTIFKADKLRMIGFNSSKLYGSDGLIDIRSSVITKTCEFSYKFNCGIDHSYGDLDSASRKRVDEELNYQASKLVTITDDPRQPIQLP